MAVALIVLAGVLAVQTHRYAAVWQSDLTLWAHAARMAPLKPRPWINLGTYWIQVGGIREARAAWQHAARLAQQASVPSWDQRVAARMARENLQALDRFIASTGGSSGSSGSP